RPVGRPEDTRVVQLVDDPRGPAVSDPQSPLKERGRTLLELDADFGRLAEERVALLVDRLEPLLGGFGLVRANDLEDVRLLAGRFPCLDFASLTVPRHQALGVFGGQ